MRPHRTQLLALVALATVAAAPRRAEQLGTLDGVFYGTELRSQLDFRTNGYTYRTIAYTFRFARDGRVARGPAAIAAGDFDAAAARAAAAPGGSVGTYAVRPGVGGGVDSVDLRWRDGTAAVFAHDPARATLSRGALRLARVASPAGARLEGTYGTQSFANLSLGAGLPQTGVAAWHEITFRRDGRFTTGGGSGVTTSSAQGGGAASEGGARAGSYRVGDYTLELAFDGGERGAIPFWVDASEAQRADPGFVVLNGAVWLRRSGAR